MRRSDPNGRSPGDRWDAARRFAASRHSVIARSELRGLGIQPRAIDRRVESGVLTVLYPGVYLMAPAMPPLAAELAAVLACGPAAYLSHAASAHVWSLPPYKPGPVKPDVTLVGRDARPRGIKVHRVRQLAPDERTTYKHLPITTPARTLLDLAPALEPRHLEQAVAEALRRRLVSHGTLHSLLARHKGRPGAPALRALLEADSPAFTRSELEERFLALIRAAGLPPPEVNARLGPYEVDFLWRDERLALETDGWDFHSDRRAFEDDRRRDAELVARGYRVIRVTWRQITQEPVAVIARLAAALAR